MEPFLTLGVLESMEVSLLMDWMARREIYHQICGLTRSVSNCQKLYMAIIYFKACVTKIALRMKGFVCLHEKANFEAKWEWPFIGKSKNNFFSLVHILINFMLCGLHPWIYCLINCKADLFLAENLNRYEHYLVICYISPYKLFFVCFIWRNLSYVQIGLQGEELKMYESSTGWASTYATVQGQPMIWYKVQCVPTYRTNV